MPQQAASSVGEYQLVISSIAVPDQNPADIYWVVTPSLNLGNQPYEVALTDGDFTNSIPNISAALGNNTFSYSSDDHDGVVSVTLPDGAYIAAGIQAVLQGVMLSNGDYSGTAPNYVYPINFISNVTFDRVQIQLNPGYNIMIPAAFGVVLGFPAGTYSGGDTVTTFTATNIATFNNRSQRLYVYTDITSGGMNTAASNSNASGIIKSVAGGALDYGQSLKDPVQYSYYPVNKKVVDSIRMRFYDSYGSIANFNGEGTNFELTFRPIMQSVMSVKIVALTEL